MASRSRHGLVLVLVLVVISILSLAAYSFSDLMFSQRKAVHSAGRQIQARALAESGLEAVQQFLTQDTSTQETAGGDYDNPGQFRGILVADDPSPQDRGRFTLIAPSMDDQGNFSGLRYGLVDESAKLNLNLLLAADNASAGSGETILMQLPGMTQDVADAILDWLDPDDTPRDQGAETEYYSGLSPAYAPKNGPIDSLDELLMVRGVTPQLLYGLDTNHDGQIEPNEAAASANLTSLGIDNSDGSMDYGWSAYLTVNSAEANLKSDGTQRININGTDLQQLFNDLQTALGEDQATFIVAYRQFGPAPSGTKGKSGNAQLDLTKPAASTGKFTNVLDLIGSQVQVTVSGSQDKVLLVSPFPNDPTSMKTYMPTLMDAVTVSDQPKLVGRININQAPRVVLAGIPGMTDEIVSNIIANRTAQVTSDKPERRFETWLMSEGIVTLDEMKPLMPYINGGGCIYRAQVVGFFDAPGPAARIEAVIDASTSAPRVLFWRDLSPLGRGFSLDTLGASAPE